MNISFLDSSPTATIVEADEQINVSSTFATKRGALLDTYQDESAIKVLKILFPFCINDFVYDINLYFLLIEKNCETKSNEEKSGC